MSWKLRRLSATTEVAELCHALSGRGNGRRVVLINDELKENRMEPSPRARASSSTSRERR